MTAPGEPMRYFTDTVLPYDGGECLLWPYARGGTGYGQLWHDGKLQVVSRLVCEKVYGPPPTRRHEAAHSCGKGHEGCVAKRHLSWKTPKANVADTLTHGTRNRGERHGAAKLTEADVLAIRSLKGVALQRDIAAQFGVSNVTICNIQTGRSWAWIGAASKEFDT